MIARALPLLLLLGSSLRAAPVARLTSEQVYQFGKTAKTKPVEHVFLVANPGDAPLKLAVGPHCDCTTIALNPAQIPPGGRGEIRFTMNPAELWGVVNKLAVVSTNDPERPELRLTFAGNVVADLQVEPSQLFFGPVDQSLIVGLEKTIKLYSPTKAFRVKGVETAPDLEAKTEPLAEAKGYLIRVKFKSKPSVGAYRENIFIYTDHEESPTKVPFGGIVTGRIDVQPPVLAFRTNDMGAKTVKISWSDFKPLNVTGAVSRLEGLTVKLKRADGEPAYLLEARFPPHFEAKQRSGSIEIQTDDADNKTLRVPVLIMDAPGHT